MASLSEDVANATIELIKAFRRHHMDAPTSILLPDKRQAMLLVKDLHEKLPNVFGRGIGTVQIKEFNGRACGYVDIANIRYYWPLDQIAQRRGGYIYG